jgi:tight adherence protein C
MSVILWIQILVFLGVLLFLLGIYYIFSYRQEKQRLIGRLTDYGEDSQKTISGKTTQPALIVQFLNLLGFLGRFGHPKKEEELSFLRKKFLLAGIRNEKALLFFWGTKVFLAIFLVVLAFLGRFVYPRPIPYFQSMALVIVPALIGFYLPNLWLKIRIHTRKDLIFKGLPDALDMLVVCVEAGMGLDAAINRVGEEMKIGNPALAEELKQVTLEMRAGKQRQEAFRNLAQRTDLEDLNSLVSLLIQTDKFGTSIGQALRVYSDSMRDKRYQRAEEVANKMVVKMIFPLVLFIFPVTGIVVAGPAVIRIFRALFAH